MTDQTATQDFEDDVDEGTPEPSKPAPEAQTIDLQANPPDQPPQRSGLTEAAALVPVGPHGAAPADFSHQVTLAQYMAKARLMVPEIFHSNVGDCLAIIDISQRAGLSPYMVAQKIYKDPKGKGIAFESQLHHAFLIGSGWLKDSALHHKFEGEGMDRRCTVWGTLRGETEPRYYTSPPLKDLLPDKNEYGKYKGSPLWGDKPDVQQVYDTTRDWGRMFAPISTLGMLAQYETIEHPLELEPPIDQGQSLRDRLVGADKSNGFKDGHAETELSQIAADKGDIKPADAEPDTIKPATEEKPKKPRGRPKTVEAKPEAAPEPKRTETLENPKAMPSRVSVQEAVNRAQALSDAKKREAAEKQPPAEQHTDDPPKPVPTKPTNAAEYQVYCLDWIEKAADPEQALARWDAERDMRDDLQVRMAGRNSLREQLEKKHGV